MREPEIKAEPEVSREPAVEMLSTIQIPDDIVAAVAQADAARAEDPAAEVVEVAEAVVAAPEPETEPSTPVAAVVETPAEEAAQEAEEPAPAEEAVADDAIVAEPAAEPAAEPEPGRRGARGGGACGRGACRRGGRLARGHPRRPEAARGPRGVAGPAPPMLFVGLTGGIGSGKSTAARMLAERGAVVLDADAFARDAIARGHAGLRPCGGPLRSGVHRARREPRPGAHRRGGLRRRGSAGRAGGHRPPGGAAPDRGGGGRPRRHAGRGDPELAAAHRDGQRP